MRAVVLANDEAREITAPDQPLCERQLQAELDASEHDRRAALGSLAEQQTRAEADAAAARTTLETFRRDNEGLVSLSFADMAELYDQRLAEKKRKPSKKETEEALRLGRLAIEEKELLGRIERAEEMASTVKSKRAEILLQPPALRVLEPCGRCPSA